MYILLALFFISLLAIVIMLGRQVKLVRAGVALEQTGYHPLEPDLVRAKYRAKRSFKRYGYVVLVVIFRIYFRIAHLVKIGYHSVRTKLIDFIARKTATPGSNLPPREASNFLRSMKEFKHTLGDLRHKIKEEEESQ